MTEIATKGRVVDPEVGVVGLRAGDRHERKPFGRSPRGGEGGVENGRVVVADPLASETGPLS